jgi:hypothetical protein
LFCRIKIQQLRSIAMLDRQRRNHLSIQQRMARQSPVEDPTMAVCPIHHGRNGEYFILAIQ